MSGAITQNDKEPIEGEVGIVAPQYFHSKEPFFFERGGKIEQLTIRYETYGELNAQKDNAIMVCHALTGDHHCAGVHSENERKTGWWNDMIGPGKPIDVNRFFVICSNCLGACQGSTGPTSINPETDKPYGLTFPDLTVSDMVRAQKLLIDHLGINQLYAVIGGSMGGMHVLQWAVEFPEIEFIRPCNLCPHMKRITLPKIFNSLQKLEFQVEVDSEVAKRARLSLERMLAVG